MRIIRSLLTLAAALSGLIVVTRAIAGPFRLLISVGSPLSAETICALSLAGLVVSGMSGPRRMAEANPRWRPQHVAMALAVVAAAFHGITRLYFFGDDFFVIRDAAVLERGRDFFHSLISSKGEIYFRPAGYTLLWLSSLALGLDPARWHMFNLMLHLANCVLLYGVSLRLGLKPWTAVLATVLFGVHGAHCEGVVWIGGSFELLSLVFVLATLLLYLRWSQAGGRWGYLLALAVLVCALWTKESAYSLPLLLLILPWNEQETWMRRLRSVAPFFAVAGVAFIHRWIILGGIGGYLDPGSGRSEAEKIHLLGVGKLLAGRLWAILLFPIDWDVKPSLLLAAATAVMLFAILYATRFPGSRTLILFSIGATIFSAMPASSQMLIGSDLYKSRTLYLPSLGFVLLLCILLEAIPRIGIRAAAAVALVVFQFAALRHNLSVWEDVSRISRTTCETSRRLVEGGPRDVTVVGLPGTIRGVYFFLNGFQECLELGHGGDWRVTFLPAGAAPLEQPGRTLLVWRGEQEGLVKVR